MNYVYRLCSSRPPIHEEYLPCVVFANASDQSNCQWCCDLSNSRRSSRAFKVISTMTQAFDLNFRIYHLELAGSLLFRLYISDLQTSTDKQFSNNSFLYAGCFHAEFCLHSCLWIRQVEAMPLTTHHSLVKSIIILVSRSPISPPNAIQFLAQCHRS